MWRGKPRLPLASVSQPLLFVQSAHSSRILLVARRVQTEPPRLKPITVRRQPIRFTWLPKPRRVTINDPGVNYIWKDLHKTQNSWLFGAQERTASVIPRPEGRVKTTGRQSDPSSAVTMTIPAGAWTQIKFPQDPKVYWFNLWTIKALCPLFECFLEGRRFWLKLNNVLNNTSVWLREPVLWPMCCYIALYALITSI